MNQPYQNKLGGYSYSRGVLLAGIFFGAIAFCCNAGPFQPTPEQLSFPGAKLQNPDKPDDETIESYYRKVTEVPEGPVLRAVVNTSYVTELFVNGNKIPEIHRNFRCGAYMYWMAGTDITRYIKPGKNVIGLRAFAGGHPLYAYLDGNIIMGSGTNIAITPAGWKVCAAPCPESWSKPDFDDASWKPAKIGSAARADDGGRVRMYSGPIVIENPYRQKLFYSDTNPVVFDIKVPAGLVTANTKLAYWITQVDTAKEIKRGELAQQKSEGGIGRYQISETQIPQGVMVLALQLKEGDRVVAERTNEPFIVTGKIKQKEIPGANLYEEMGLTLYDTINCTDPKDPHPVLEGGSEKGRIVQEGNLRYRETGGRHQTVWGGKTDVSFLTYKIKFDRLDEPYLIVFEYPDNKERDMEFAVATWPDDPKKHAEKGVGFGYNPEGGGAMTGGRFPLSGKIKSYPLLYFPAKQDAILIVNTAAPKMPAAASRILIYRAADIPALNLKPSNERFLGIHTERGYSFRKLLSGTVFDEDKYTWVSSWGQRWSPETFALWYKTAERLVKYLRFSGQNLHVIGCFQYDTINTPYSWPTFMGDSRLEPDFREIVAALFSENNLFLLGSLELLKLEPMLPAQGVPSPFPSPTDEEMQKGAETAWCVSAKGKQLGEGYFGYIPNIFHPQVQAYLLRLVDGLCGKLATFPAFQGLYVVDGPDVFGYRSAMGLIPAFYPNAGYEDITVELFEKETGTQIPVDKKDPERFAKRYEWIKDNAKDKWIDWRCRKTKEVRMMILNRMRQQRPDLRLVCAYHDWKNNPDQFKNAGMDLDLYKKEKGLSIARYSPVGGGHGIVEHNTGMQALEDQVKIAAFDRQTDRTVGIKNIFDETVLSNEITDEWPFKLMCVGGPPMLAGEHMGWQFSRVAIDSDPDTIIFGWGDDNFLPGHEQAIANFARGFLTLPGQKLDLLTKPEIDSNIGVRAGVVNGRYVFYLINPGWWRAEAEIEIAGAEQGQILELAQNTPVEGKKAGANMIIRATLPPYGARSYAVSSAKAGITQVKVTADQSAADGLKELIERARHTSENPNLKDILPEEELAYVGHSLQQATLCLKAGKYVEGWRYFADAKLTATLGNVNEIGWIRPWLAIGPFPNNESMMKKEDETLEAGQSGDAKDEYCQGFDRVFDAEKDTLAAGAPARGKTYQGAGKNGALKWREIMTVNRNDHCYVDFWPLFTPKNWTVGYAWTKVYADSETKAKLMTGSDDGAKVWLNGELVIRALKARGATWGDDQKEVTLKKGLNTILVKIENRRGGFGFYLDFVGADNKPLENLKYSVK